MRKNLIATYIFLVFAAGFLAQAAAGARTRLLNARESSLVAAINAVRLAKGLIPVAVDLRLERAARAHSHDMLLRQYFAHGAFMQRMRRFHVRGPSVGENLAWHTGWLAAASAVQMWLASPEHRANMLRPGFRRVGVATPVGRFAGAPRATVITADFAGR
jgi:uncharacterized protein YkwD